MFKIHNYETMTQDKRPQDSELDGTGCSFETLEHGGEYPDAMPQAIRFTDVDGHSAVYTPITVGGKVVDSKGFSFSSTESDRCEPFKATKES